MAVMDGDLYDEFGNYIGPELESDESEEEGYVDGMEEVIFASESVCSVTSQFGFVVY